MDDIFGTHRGGLTANGEIAMSADTESGRPARARAVRLREGGGTGAASTLGRVNISAESREHAAA